METALADEILALQLLVAWAGEARCDPRRLGWWDTDIVDKAGGGDFLRRLLPQTHAWAALEAVREAARRTDAQARRTMADPDRMRSLFFLGFEIDECVGERLAALKREGRLPSEALSFPISLDGAFDRRLFEDRVRAIAGDVPSFSVIPGGRQLKGASPTSTTAMVRQLAGALLPLADQYPLPFFKVAA